VGTASKRVAASPHSPASGRASAVRIRCEHQPLETPRPFPSRQRIQSPPVHQQNSEAGEAVAILIRLRRKIEADPAEPRYLRTITGVGYVLEAAGAVHG
jgi:hypothetical protein